MYRQVGTRGLSSLHYVDKGKFKNIITRASNSKGSVFEKLVFPDEVLDPALLEFTSGNSSVAELIKVNGYDESSFRAFFDTRYVTNKWEAYCMLRMVPAINVNGDSSIIAPDGTTYSQSPALTQNNYLTDEERIRARHIVRCSVNQIYASGGYPSGKPTIVIPWSAVIISAAGCQFERPGLEQTIAFEGGTVASFDSSAYERAIYHDFQLYFRAFSVYIPLGKRGVLRVPKIGMGFFANFNMGPNISSKLARPFVSAMIRALSEAPAYIEIEFYDFEGNFVVPGTPRMKVVTRTDILARPVDTTKLVGIINAGDVFSWAGNEHSYASVEAMIGNNSDLRATQVPCRNSKITVESMIPVDLQ